METSEPAVPAIDLDVLSADLDDVQWALECIQRDESARCARCEQAAAEGSLTGRAALVACVAARDSSDAGTP